MSVSKHRKGGAPSWVEPPQPPFNHTGPGTKRRAEGKGALLDAALALEPELRTLHGVLMALRHLGERADPIDPAAIAVLAAVGEGALAKAKIARQSMEAKGTRESFDQQ